MKLNAKHLEKHITKDLTQIFSSCLVADRSAPPRQCTAFSPIFDRFFSIIADYGHNDDNKGKNYNERNYRRIHLSSS